MKKTVGKKLGRLLSAVVIMTTLGTHVVNVQAEGNPYAGGWGNCTWSAWQLVYESTGIALPSWGNAGEWAYNAASDGWYVSSIPAVNTVIVWSHHVGYVTDISEDGSQVYVREGNYAGSYHEGWSPAYEGRSGQNLIGYIYLGDTVPESYYRPEDLEISNSEFAQKKAQQAQMIAQEAETVVKVEDDTVTDVIKTEEEEAKADLLQEDASTTTVISLK